jgi:hypothetical protein
MGCADADEGGGGGQRAGEIASDGRDDAGTGIAGRGKGVAPKIGRGGGRHGGGDPISAGGQRDRGEDGKRVDSGGGVREGGLGEEGCENIGVRPTLYTGNNWAGVIFPEYVTRETG